MHVFALKDTSFGENRPNQLCIGISVLFIQHGIYEFQVNMTSTRRFNQILVVFLENRNCTTLCKGRHRFSFSLDILTGLACWQLGCIQGNDDLANLLYEQVVYYPNFVLMKGKKWFQVSRFWLHGHEHQGWRKVIKSGVASSKVHIF